MQFLKGNQLLLTHSGKLPREWRLFFTEDTEGIRSRSRFTTIILTVPQLIPSKFSTAGSTCNAGCCKTTNKKHRAQCIRVQGCPQFFATRNQLQTYTPADQSETQDALQSVRVTQTHRTKGHSTSPQDSAHQAGLADKPDAVPRTRTSYVTHARTAGSSRPGARPIFVDAPRRGVSQKNSDQGPRSADAEATRVSRQTGRVLGDRPAGGAVTRRPRFGGSAAARRGSTGLFLCPLTQHCARDTTALRSVLAAQHVYTCKHTLGEACLQESCTIHTVLAVQYVPLSTLLTSP